MTNEEHEAIIAPLREEIETERGKFKALDESERESYRIMSIERDQLRARIRELEEALRNWNNHDATSGQRITELERALRDALKCFTGTDIHVTAERIEAWEAVLKGKCKRKNESRCIG